ncbi:MAG: tRNA pseudouridine(13) synthase TruD [Nanoarchaeota archaeon]
MHKIKQAPEDFIVKEINDVAIGDTGKYAYFILKKKNYNTIKAIETIAKALGINVKNIGFAGNKDRNAVTEQLISIKNERKDFEKIILKDIELKYLGKGSEEIYLGRLKGNEFNITMRSLTQEEIKKIEEKAKNKQIFMPNYFGEQRFSKSNHWIGKAITNRDFKKAVELVLESNSEQNERIEEHLQKQKNDFIVALKITPFKMLKLYVHSYQSFLFNKALEEYISISMVGNKANYDEKIPIVGFSTELKELKNKQIKKIIEKIMEEEKITERDFIIRAIPDLSSEGSERNAFIKINDFKIIKAEKDELNEGKKKVVVSFSLPKGCYATVLMDFLFNA